MGITLSVKKLGLALVSSVVERGIGLLPGRVRAIVADRAPMVRALDYPRRRILLHVDSELEYRVRLRSASKEPETVRWIESFADGDVFYDIGANVGAYSLIAAKLFEGRVRVCAFEPSALNFGQLVKNLALNTCGDTVTPLPVALGAATKMDTFNYQNVARGGALHSVGEAVDENGRRFTPALRQRLLVYTLDDVVHAYGLAPPSHIKIDVDGGEAGILAGSRTTLASPSLRSVLMEARIDNGDGERLGAVMAQAGFRLSAQHPAAPGYANLVFSRRAADSPAPVIERVLHA